jgi:hypothetical protein
VISKIPLGPPLEKGEDNGLPVRNPILSPPFVKGGWGDFFYGHGFGLNTDTIMFIAPVGAHPFGLAHKAKPSRRRGGFFTLAHYVVSH